ncbi:ABC transporter substrate-binding protein [Insulibacter thermoxylanivorax]|uniref:ABC transporter substrate-binding protein n=1 Tax=Insulibacter thermoxylanivorax TaxID=2749268 RepID=A0A916QC83_9BACL|nr:ABC transporter substrate-binding protein [Insulibacter thermoxylanivorax]GFR36718.1 ABC transporter substrate-binding protein [Insulibacter thermoxylanivorax]
MKKTTRLVAIFFIIASLLTLAACGSSNNGGNTSPGNSSTNTEQGTGGDGALDPITFSWFSADPVSNWNNMQDKVGQEITRRTGVTLQAQFAMDQNAIPLMIASGDYPDLISPKGDAAKLVDAGALLDLRPLLEEHGQNILKVYGDYIDRLRWSKDDDAIYILPSLNAVDHQYMDIGGAFHIQHEALKATGYPELKTVKDYEETIKKFLEENPTTQDGQKRIGITFLADGWRILIGVTNPAFLTTGAPDDGEVYIDPETYEVTYHYRRPVEKEYFRWLNHINNIGLLDPEAFTQKEDQYKAKIATGRVVGVIDQDWGFQDAVNSLKAEGKFEQTYAHFPITLTEEYKDHQLQSSGFMGGWGTGISVNCKDPVRAIKFLDFLASEEGQILINWGIEDEHYYYDEEGVRRIFPEVQERKNNDANAFAKETGIGFYHISARYGDGVKDSTGNYYTTTWPEQVIDNYHKVEKETLAHYGVDRWIELWPQPDEFPVKAWGAAWDIPVPSDSEYAILAKRMEEITWQRIPQIILADPSEFDALWDAYMQELINNGVEKMEDEFEQYVKERVELWGGKVD